ncbi:hypothetical protein Pme01_55720 [Planosporangium mesophilum]|uniref:Uncharacterized protein n=1 Tax=Planosporangium mesophilum TaxID=689768 RepID=A0A8J3TF27_9ACTN|nr:hypothetical protein Pme01_55720 [Planosporangium mesophilum]
MVPGVRPLHFRPRPPRTPNCLTRQMEVFTVLFRGRDIDYLSPGVPGRGGAASADVARPSITNPRRAASLV